MTTDPWLDQFNAERTARRHDQQARSFEILGETLTVKPGIAPQVMVTYFAAKRELLELYIARDAAETNGDEGPEIPAHLQDPPLLDLLETTARACLTPDSHPVWERLRAADHPDPLGWDELFSLCEYLIGRASTHPTDAPGGSSNGRKATRRSSAAASSSPATTPTN